MRPSIVFTQHRNEIREIIERRGGVNPRVFGSVLHGDDTDESDLDILIDGSESLSLFDMGGMSVELTELLGVKVDIVIPNSLPERWKEEVLCEVQAI